MARPETIDDIKDEQDKFIEIATFSLKEFQRHPNLVKAYADFANAAARHGATITDDYRGPVIKLPKTKQQLEEQLRTDQYRWDDMEKTYVKGLSGEFVPSYRHNSVNAWARDNGRTEVTDWAEEPAKEDA